MTHQKIIEQFHAWRKLTYPGVPLEPGSEQYKQLRFAFFGGSASLLVELLAMAGKADSVGVESLNRYMVEITGFLASEKENHQRKQ